MNNLEYMVNWSVRDVLNTLLRTNINMKYGGRSECKIQQECNDSIYLANIMSSVFRKGLYHIFTQLSLLLCPNFILISFHLCKFRESVIGFQGTCPSFTPPTCFLLHGFLPNLGKSHSGHCWKE